MSSFKGKVLNNLEVLIILGGLIYYLLGFICIMPDREAILLFSTAIYSSVIFYKHFRK